MIQSPAEHSIVLSAINGNDVIRYALTQWMSLDNTVQSEKSWAQKDNHCTIPHVLNIQNK